MSDLWAANRERARRGVEPLAVRMRPRTLEEFAGQEHILAPGKLLWRMIRSDALTSIILHGPPGTGKTTLAELIALATKRRFVRENASSVGVKRIREIIDEAAALIERGGQRTILFLDEIHRFTRAQQDVLLGDVERGIITLIGATTENPLFAVNSALVSRSTLFRLEALSEEQITDVLRRALRDEERGYGKLSIEATGEALKVWAVKSDGDARRALNALEVAVLSSGGSRNADTAVAAHAPLAGDDMGTARSSRAREQRPLGSGQRSPQSPGEAHGEKTAPALVIDRALAEDSIQQKAAVYDQTGDEHYDAASAMIKSVRGSDPDAALYWIARMLEGGEDPRFIARRLAILASEDIGNADPHAISVAASCWELVERIGLPEARITLAQCACYLALAPKSNAAYLAIDQALEDVREGRTLPVPVHIKDGNVRKASLLSEGGLGKGERYKYAHDEPDAVGTQDYLGVAKRYYLPTALGAEEAMAKRLEEIRARRQAARENGPR